MHLIFMSTEQNFSDREEMTWHIHPCRVFAVLADEEQRWWTMVPHAPDNSGNYSLNWSEFDTEPQPILMGPIRAQTRPTSCHKSASLHHWRRIGPQELPRHDLDSHTCCYPAHEEITIVQSTCQATSHRAKSSIVTTAVATHPQFFNAPSTAVTSPRS